jgi:hypothetical protein
MRKKRRELEADMEDSVEKAADAKDRAEIQKKRAEQEATFRKKVEEFRKDTEERHKKFRLEADGDHKAFEDQLKNANK